MSQCFSDELVKESGVKRLICFPHAGGGTAIFHRLGQALSTQIRVLPAKLPGRESRLKDPPFEVLSELVDHILPEIEPLMRQPVAFLGHSMGAMLAYEIAHRMRNLGPEVLFLSACRPPTSMSTEAKLHEMPTEQMLDELVERYGTGNTTSDERALMQLLANTIRADLKMLENRVHAEYPPLDCPIVALGGVNDGLVNRTELSKWQDETTGHFRVRMFPGGHFYLRERLPEVAQLIENEFLTSQ